MPCWLTSTAVSKCTARNFIPPHAEGIPTTSSLVEENEEFCFIYSFESWIFLFRLGNHFFLFLSFFLVLPISTRWPAWVVVSCVCWREAGREKKETPHPVHYRPIFGGPRVKRPTTAARKGLRKTKAERERENERRKKGRFILSFSLLRGRLDRSRGRQNNSWRLSKFPSRCWLLFCSKFHWAFFFRKSP